MRLLPSRVGCKERGIHTVLYATSLSKIGLCYLLVVYRGGIELRFLIQVAKEVKRAASIDIPRSFNIQNPVEKIILTTLSRLSPKDSAQEFSNREYISNVTSRNEKSFAVQQILHIARPDGKAYTAWVGSRYLKQ